MNFIKRNAPVLIIGLLTVFVFVAIIIAGQANPPTGPRLKEVSEKDLVSAHSYVNGNENAPVTLTEFSDFGCPACAAIQPYVKDLLARFPTKLKLVYRHFPLPQHKNSVQAAAAAQIAGEQGKFWTYGDILFANQEKFERADLIKYAEDLKMDMDAFTTALDSKKYETIVNEDAAEGQRLGINSTPTFYLNGLPMVFKTFDDFVKQVEDACNKVAEPSNTTDAAPLDIPTVVKNTTPTETTKETTMSQEELDKKYGVLSISFTDKGFTPGNTQATLGQLVRWENKTATNINLIQVTKMFPELNKPVTIEPNKTFEMRVYNYGSWTYKDVLSDKGGTILILAPKKAGSTSIYPDYE